jgi:hypothetical protein
MYALLRLVVLFGARMTVIETRDRSLIQIRDAHEPLSAVKMAYRTDTFNFVS